MAKNSTTDIELLAGLSIDSSEQEILRAIKIIEKRLKANHDARFKLNVDIDETVINNTIAKLQNALKNKDLKIETQDSIVAITKEANAMLDVVGAAKKATREKLEFTKANRQVKDSANDTADAINRERTAMNNLDDLDSILHNVNMSGRQGASVFQSFGNSLRDAMSTYTMANLLHEGLEKVVEAGKEAIEITKKFDDINVDLQMATGEDKDYVKGLLADYAELGGELGALTETVAESADTFLRQGRSMEETNQLIEDAIVLSKVAQTSGEKASEILTATINGFQLAATEGSRVSDILSSIDLNSASSAEGIGEALTKTASMAHNAGVSLEKTAAMIATIKDVTQDADTTIGTSLKTVLSRMNSIRAGKFIDEESGEALNDVEKVLGGINVSMRDVNGQFKEAEAIIDEVGIKWKSLDKNTQKAVTTAMGGVYQSNKLVSLFDNYDKVIELTKIAEESAGTALQKFNDSYLPSLEAKTNALKSSLQSLATSTISDEFYGSVLDTTKAIVDMTTETGILKGALAGLATSGAVYAFEHLTAYLHDATQEFANLGEAMQITRGANGTITDIQRLIDLTSGLSESQTRLLLNTRNLTDAQRTAILVNQYLAQGMDDELARATAEATLQTWGLTTAQNTATGAAVTLRNTLRGLWATLLANPLVLVSTVVTVGVMAFNKYKQAQEETLHVTQKVQESLEESVNTFKESTKEVENLNDELKNCAEKITELQKLDDAGTISIADAEQLKLLKETNEELERKLALEQAEAVKKGKDALKAAKDVSDTKIKSQYISEWDEGAAMSIYQQVTPAEELEASIQAYKHYLNQLNSFDESIYASKDVAQNIKKGLEKDVSNAESRIYEIQQIISDTVSAYDTLKEAGFTLDEEAQAEYDGLRKVQDAYLLFNYELLKTKESFQGLNTEQQKNILLNRLLEQGLTDTQAQSVINNISDAKLDDAWDTDFTFIQPEVTDYTTIEEYGKAYAKAWLKGIEDIIEEGNVTKNERLSETEIESLETYQKNIKTISSALADLNNLETSDITSLMTEFSAYGEVFEQFGVNGTKGVGDLQGALQEIARQMRDTATGAVPQFVDAIEDMFYIILHPMGDFNEVRSELDELLGLYDDLNASKTMDEKSANALIKKYPELADAVKNVGEEYSFEIGSIVDLANKRIEYLNTISSYEHEATLQQLKDVESRISAYEAEYKAVNGLASNRPVEVMAQDPAYRALLSEKREIQKLIEELELNGLLEQIEWDGENCNENSEIDWLNNSIENLQENVDDLQRTLDNTKGWQEQLTAIDNLNKGLKTLQDTYYSTEDNSNTIYGEYESRYEDSLNELTQHGIDKSSIRTKIEAGHIFNEEEFSSDVMDIVNDAIDAYNGMKDAENKYLELGVQIKENDLEKLNVELDHLSSVRDKLQTKFDNAISVSDKEKAYRYLVPAIRQEYQKEIEIAEQNGNLEEAHRLGLEMKKTMHDAKTELLEFRKDNASDLKDLAQSKLDANPNASLEERAGWYDELEKATVNYYDIEIELAKHNKDAIAAENLELEKKKALNDIHISQLEEQSDYYEQIISAVEKRYDEEIDRIDETIESIQEFNEELERQKDDYDAVIFTVVDYFNEQKDGLQSSIDAINEENDLIQEQIDEYDGLLNAVTLVFEEERSALESEQKLIDDRISSLQEENDERDKALALEQAKYDLARLQTQRTKKVLTADGVVYKTDDEAISDARDKVADLEFDATIDALEKEKELLQDIIDELDEAEKSWSKVSSAFGDNKALSSAENLLGSNFRDVILNADPSVIEDYTNRYSSAQQKIEDNEKLIESIEEEMNKYDELIEKWESVATAKEEATNREITASILGRDWQKQVLDEETLTLEDFKDDYIKLEEQILSNKEEIESLEKKKKYYSDLKEEWTSLSDAQTTLQGELKASQELGASWESDILNGRLGKWKDFRDKYIKIQEEIAKATAITDGSTTITHTTSESRSAEIPQFHTGLEKGYVGNALSDAKRLGILQKAGKGELNSDEVIVKLKDDELVLTKMQQINIADSLLQRAIVPNVNLPDYSHLSNVVQRNSQVSFGDININCPGITSQQVAKQVQDELLKQFRNFRLDALQYAHKRHF